jgi:hypothetical protein
VTFAEQGAPPGAFTAWVRTNGTAIAVDFSGQNMTGSQANDFYKALMLAFSGEIGITNELTSGALSPYLHQTTKGTATFGPTTMNVVNYAANSLPFTASGCGENQTITAYSLQTGSVPSSSQPLLTFLNMDVSFQGPLGSGSIDETIQLVSVTLA